MKKTLTLTLTALIALTASLTAGGPPPFMDDVYNFCQEVKASATIVVEGDYSTSGKDDEKEKQKIDKISLNTKDILAEFPKGSKLYLCEGDTFVITGKDGRIITTGEADVETSEEVCSYDYNDNTWKENGTCYSNALFPIDLGDVNIFFAATMKETYSYSKVNKNDEQTFKSTSKSSALGGQGEFDGDTAVVTKGSLSLSGKDTYSVED